MGGLANGRSAASHGAGLAQSSTCIATCANWTVPWLMWTLRGDYITLPLDFQIFAGHACPPCNHQELHVIWFHDLVRPLSCQLRHFKYSMKKRSSRHYMTHLQRVVELFIDLKSQLPWKRGRFTLYQLDGRASRRRFNTELYQAHIFDSWSSSKPCGSRETCGERLSNAATQLSILGFSPVYISALSKSISDTTNRAFDRHLPSQSNSTTSTQPITYSMSMFVAEPGPYLNHKQNVKTREQHKAQAMAQHVTVQVQEVESIQISVEKACTYMVLQCVQPGAWNMAMLHHPDGLSTAMNIPSHSWIWQPAMEIGTSR